jgi:PAS domain S-box-containing protein
MGKIRKFIDYIFAEDEDLTLEYRIFLSAIIVGVFTSLVGSIINLVLNTSVTAAIIPLFLSTSLIVIYYFVRVKGKFEPFIFPIIIMSIVGISIIWVFNGGINGSNVMPGFVILILGLITVSNKKKKYVFALFVGLFSVVYLIQFYRPDLIVNFSNETDRWIDSIFTLFYSSYFIFLIIKYFHENYSREKRKVSESEEKYRQAFQTSSDAININQRDGAYIDVNEGFTNLTGYTLNDVMGKFSTEINIWAIPEDLEKMVTGLRERGSVKNLESKFRCKDGSIKTAIMSADIIVLNNEPHILTITRDITERKEMEELILKSKQQYDNLVSNIPVGVYVLHTKPEGTFTLDYVSPRMAEMLGLSIESLISNASVIFEAIHPDEVEGFARLNQEGIQQKKPFNWKGRVVVNDNIKWLNISSLPQELESGDTLWHGLIVDITERMMAEAEIKQKNEELVKLNATKDKFFSIIAHDLRSPFNGFLGLTQMMAEDLPNMTMPQAQKMAASMSKSATNMYRLLEDLLQWSQIQKGALPFNPEVIPLNLIVSETIALLFQPATNKGIEITTDISDDLTVFADSNILQTIIRNLTYNAVKYTTWGGKVNVKAKNTESKCVEISVEDTGIGMDQVILDNLFKVDARINRKGTEGEPSTGLGLILCKEFIEKHGGKIWVKSEVGKGSTFSFKLPR